jgi:hypothetical protein
MEWYDNRGEKLNTLSSPERPFQPTEPGAPLWAGEWGRRERAAYPIGMSLRVDEDGAVLAMPCGSIGIRGRIVPDRTGRFTASGLYLFARCVVEESAGVPVRVEGRVAGDSLKLTVTRERDAGRTDGGARASGSHMHATPYDDGPRTFVRTYGVRAVPPCELR